MVSDSGGGGGYYLGASNLSGNSIPRYGMGSTPTPLILMRGAIGTY